MLIVVFAHTLLEALLVDGRLLDHNPRVPSMPRRGNSLDKNVRGIVFAGVGDGAFCYARRIHCHLSVIPAMGGGIDGYLFRLDMRRIMPASPGHHTCLRACGWLCNDPLAPVVPKRLNAEFPFVYYQLLAFLVSEDVPAVLAKVVILQSRALARRGFASRWSHDVLMLNFVRIVIFRVAPRAPAIHMHFVARRLRQELPVMTKRGYFPRLDMGGVVTAHAPLDARFGAGYRLVCSPLAPLMVERSHNDIFRIHLNPARSVGEEPATGPLPMVANPILRIAGSSARRLFRSHPRQGVDMCGRGNRTGLDVVRIVLTSALFDALLDLGSLFGHHPFAPVMSTRIDGDVGHGYLLLAESSIGEVFRAVNRLALRRASGVLDHP